MSLLTSASVWTTDDTQQKKKTPSMRKTIKRTDSYNEEPSEYVSQDDEYRKMSNTIENTHEKQEARNTQVNTLLNKITSVDAGNKLANFNPMVNPALTVKAAPPVYDDNIANGYDNPLQIEPPRVPKTVGENKHYGSLGNNPNVNYSNYKQSYEQASGLNRYGGGNAGVVGDNFNNKLLDKINYMIHMLEEQHNEKTNNITEEFILYMFLGVFIIFIVDSFSRAGKYIR